MKVYSCPTRKIKITQKLDGHWIPEATIWKTKKQKQRNQPTYQTSSSMLTQVSYSSDETHQLKSDVYVISDFDRNDCIWRVPISVIRELFELASDDYPSRLKPH